MCCEAWLIPCVFDQPELLKSFVLKCSVCVPKIFLILNSFIILGCS